MKKYLMVCSLAGEERLHFIGSENSNNLFVCHRESGASTDDERQQMNEVGQIDVGEFINTFRLGSLVMQNLGDTETGLGEIPSLPRLVSRILSRTFEFLNQGENVTDNSEIKAGISQKGFKDNDESEEDDNEAVNVDEKENTVDEIFSPGAQGTPKHPTSGLLALVTSEQTVYNNQKRSSLAPSKPGRSTGLGETEAKTPIKSQSNNLSPGHRVSGAFHAKASSITGSLTGSEAAISDSTISFTSSRVSGVSSGRGKAMDCSQADSERDSVYPQRTQDPEVSHMSSLTGKIE